MGKITVESIKAARAKIKEFRNEIATLPARDEKRLFFFENGIPIFINDLSDLDRKHA